MKQMSKPYVKQPHSENNLQEKQQVPVHDVYSAEETGTKKNDSKKHIKRTTLDIPISMYKEIKRCLIDDDLTMKDYFLGLVEKDLKSRKHGL